MSGPFLPVEGGSDNDYEYAAGDPINNLDLDGEACWGPFRDKKCKVRDAYRKLGKTLRRGKAGYDLWRNASRCLKSKGANVDSCVSTFFNSFTAAGSPLLGSPAYTVLLKSLGKVWGCTVNSATGMATQLGDKRGIWVGAGTTCPFFVPSK